MLYDVCREGEGWSIVASIVIERGSYGCLS